MKILITGGTGLIGRNLIKRLKGDITVVARQRKHLSSLKKEFPHIRILAIDISYEPNVIKALKGIDVVYHLAAMRAVGKAEKQVFGCVSTNIIGTINLLKHFKGKRFVTLSTDKAVQIKSVYGASKFIVERLVVEYMKLNPKTKYLVIRSGNIFGSTDSVMSVWKNKLLTKQPITVTDLAATRYFCTVDQVIDYIIRGPLCFSGVLCMTLKSTSLSTLLRAMQIKYGKAVSIDVIGRQVGENKHERLYEGGLSSDKANRYTVKELIKLI